MSEIKLLPCPFCGGEAIMYTTENFDICGDEPINYMIGCKNCCAVEPMTEWCESKENAIAQWNYRKPMQDIVKRLEQQVRQCEIRQKEFQSTNATVKISEKFYSKACSYDNAITIVKEVGGMNDSV